MTEARNIRSESCVSGGDLVAYLYNELTLAERSAFESHLTGCSICTDEFAGLSFARLDVYEWHRDEFAHIPTPRFAIPYGEAAKASWLNSVRAFARQYRWAAGGALAAITLVVAAYFLFLSAGANEHAQIATLPSTPVETARKPEPLERKSITETAATTKGIENRTPAFPLPERASVSVKKNLLQPEMRARAGVASARPKTAQPAALKRSGAPRLNDFDDEDDNTLRLGDLLADVGTGKE